MNFRLSGRSTLFRVKFTNEGSTNSAFWLITYQTWTKCKTTAHSATSKALEQLCQCYISAAGACMTLTPIWHSKSKGEGYQRLEVRTLHCGVALMMTTASSVCLLLRSVCPSVCPATSIIASCCRSTDADGDLAATRPAFQQHPAGTLERTRHARRDANLYWTGANNETMRWYRANMSRLSRADVYTRQYSIIDWMQTFCAGL